MDNVTEPGDFPEGVSGYRLYHGYVSVIVCSTGIVLNVINAVIWSSKNMRSSTNLILTTLAITDIVSLSMYLVYAVYFFLATGPSQQLNHSQELMYVVVIAFHEFIGFHTTSNWLTISLAIFRFIKVCHPDLAKTWCNKERAKLTILIVFVVTILATFPFYPYYEVYSSSEDHPSLTGYWIRKTKFTRNHVLYQTVLLWLYGVVFKVCPCIGMVVLSTLMIRKLRHAQKRQRTFITGPDSQVNNHRGYSHTTVMLIIIGLIYVLMELPIGISAFTSGLQGGESHYFYFMLYSEVGDILDLLTLLNATVNFGVYYALSNQFRAVCRKIFLREKVLDVHCVSDTLEMSEPVTSSVIFTISLKWKSFKQKVHLDN